MENVKGTSIYGYKAYEGGTSTSSKLYELKEDWSTPIILPEIRTVTPINIGKVSNFDVTKTDNGNKISFDKMDDAKFYVLYRSTEPLTYTGDEVLDVIGDVSVDNKIEYVDSNAEDGKTYYYGVRAQSYSLRLGEGVSKSTEGIQPGSELSLGPVCNYGITDNLISGEKVTVFWDEKYYPFGSDIDYSIEYAFDNGEVKTSTNYYKQRNRLNFDIVIPSDVQKLDVNIVCKNSLGSSKTLISKSITEALPEVKNFGYVGTPYLNEKLTFVWNNIRIDGVKYILQYSADNYFWSDLKEITDVSEANNIRTEIVIENAKGYYRIYAVKGNMSSYSKVVDFSTQEYLGDYRNLLVNGEEMKFSYVISEGDKVTITWKKHTNDAVYSLMVSEDQKNWIGIRNYTTKVNLTDDGSTVTAEVTISDKYYGLYIKISGIDGSSRNESEYIKIDVQKDVIFYDELSNYLVMESQSFGNKVNLFN